MSEAIEMAECCGIYVRHSLDLIAEWGGFIVTQELHGLSAASYATAIADTAAGVQKVLDEGRCPWHDDMPHDYIAVMGLTKSALPTEETK